MMYGDGTWGWPLLMLMPLVWLVLVGAIVWAVVRLAQSGAAPGPTYRRPERDDSAQEILDRRFASGEIDEEAYTRARAHLAGRDPASP